MCTSTLIVGERQGGGGGAESSSGAAMKAKTAAAPAAEYDPDAAQRDAALKALPGPRLEAADALIAARKRTAAEAATAEAARAAAEAKLCVVCVAAPKDSVLAPCGHKCVCGPCAAKNPAADLPDLPRATCGRESFRVVKRPRVALSLSFPCRPLSLHPTSKPRPK